MGKDKFQKLSLTRLVIKQLGEIGKTSRIEGDVEGWRDTGRQTERERKKEFERYLVILSKLGDREFFLQQTPQKYREN